MNTHRFVTAVGALCLWMAAGDVGALGGTVHFIGAVVESPCELNITATAARTECYRNGRDYQSLQHTLPNFDTTRKELPRNLGTTEIRWVDQQQQLAMMTVDYR
ncbi:type 1 fimbrial protein [Serratia rhizosphaerae]|uniref:type 1 fimbrial protein n=1 Tax=unclassified Serratia (in: enterobacteria) TaxID=2647522 RepID=UPI000CF699F1|nr:MULTISPECIES: type 1 fimbrial protein [unclassified Serratia (in: enterobacteria)]MBU3892143.1 type 1 fimbrial protein [Serratia rubidaea]AVJ18513.1 fimbrial protein [Serratia sp. MYb239]MCA4822739.1 type 1 fimbrial protein [Serratia rubidaea]QNK33993.1 type 1 fimbrial protein [Serratia sp. JUb9]QPT12064.1 type 1 fimbrial protein [Serratia rubidaea]